MSVGKSPKTKNKNSSTPLTPDQVSGYFNALDTLTGGSHVAPTTTREWVPDASGGGMSADPSNPMSFLYGGKNGDNWAQTGSAGGHWETRTTPGSDSAGRLGTFATTGTPETDYQPANAYVQAPQTQAEQARTYLAPHPDQAGYWFVDPVRQLAAQESGVTPTTGYQELSADALRAVGGMGATRQADAQRARQDALAQIGSDAGLDVFQRARSRQQTNQDYSARMDAIAKETEAAISQLASTERGRTLANDQFNAGNQLQNNQFNAGQRSRADENNVGRELQRDIFNATQGSSTDQFNIGNQISTDRFNVGNLNQGSQFNTSQRASTNDANAARAAAAAALNQQAALTEAGRQYSANAANAQLTRDDLLALAQIYFGGKGTTSTGSSSGGGWSFGLNI